MCRGLLKNLQFDSANYHLYGVHLIITTNDLTRVQQGKGLMTLTHVTAVMTRNPKGEGVWLEVHLLTDVHKRHKFHYQDPSRHSHLVC